MRNDSQERHRDYKPVSYHFSPPFFAVWTQPRTATELLDDHRALEPPDPIPNSEVKRCIADGSVGLPHVRVGHRQAPNRNPAIRRGFLLGVCQRFVVTTAPCDKFAGSEFGQPQAAQRARAWMACVNVGYRQASNKNPDLETGRVSFSVSPSHRSGVPETVG